MLESCLAFFFFFFISIHGRFCCIFSNVTTFTIFNSTRFLFLTEPYRELRTLQPSIDIFLIMMSFSEFCKVLNETAKVPVWCQWVTERMIRHPQKVVSVSTSEALVRVQTFTTIQDTCGYVMVRLGILGGIPSAHELCLLRLRHKVHGLSIRGRQKEIWKQGYEIDGPISRCG